MLEKCGVTVFDEAGLCRELKSDVLVVMTTDFVMIFVILQLFCYSKC